jgi:hypothetical protein
MRVIISIGPEPPTAAGCAATRISARATARGRVGACAR